MKTEQDGGLVIGRDLVNDCVRYAPSLDLLYLNNPKSGCTTIKYALWCASDAAAGTVTLGANIHDRKAAPFPPNVFRLSRRRREQIAQAAVFSVVRNPFSRALSAYVDKVANDPIVWRIFLKRFGLKPTVGKRELCFADFLSLIAAAHDDILDGHFRPQYRNLLLPLANPVFVGSVEDIRPVAAFLREHLIPFSDQPMNATRAQEEFAHSYDARAAGLVRHRYARDFVYFGYSPELADTRACPRGGGLSARKDLLLKWLATGTRPAGVSEPQFAFATFAATTDREKKLRLARVAFQNEHNWSRLLRYANFVRSKSRERDLQEAIHDHMAALRSRYAEALSRRDIFLDFP